ncbi:SUMO-interacting motif-containing protein 1-like isoform X2 [Antedon mediterranea]
METSPITPFMERHTLSPQNFLKTNNKFSPIKRSETLKGSINNNSRTIKCIKPFRNLNIKQVWHHLSKKTKDQLSKISNEVIVLSHNQHSQLLSSALPTHLNNDFYRDVQRPHMNDVQNQTVEMSNIHNNIIEGHQEEEVHSEAITYIHDFTTTDIYPEKQCLKYLLDTLVAVGSRDLTCQTYKTLKHIQNHHKLTRKDFSEDWNQIMDILKPLETECNILFYRNRLLYLDLLTSVLEEDLNKHKLRNTTAQSFLCKMLSPDHEMANLASLSLCLLSVLQRTFDNSSDMFLEEGIQRSLLLLQKILTLSVEVSKSRPEGAMKIAEHLLYPFRNLSKVEHRSQLLETMQSNLLRIKLIELWLENCCVVRDVCIPTSGDPISINKILNRHFRCTPSSTVEDASVACEELAMMLYLLLKSYLAYNAEKIHPNATDNASCYCGLKLSREESTLFLTMGDVVTKLRNHLSSYGELTTKTLAYLSYIESLQDLVDI